jgi:tRNA-dihydrouridine synthase
VGYDTLHGHARNDDNRREVNMQYIRDDRREVSDFVATVLVNRDNPRTAEFLLDMTQKEVEVIVKLLNPKKLAKIFATTP